MKEVVVPTVQYQDNEGTIHATEIDALRADERIREKADHVFHFGRTFRGQRLLEKHQLNEYGTWEVRGEDPNCDMGGYHHEPLLGYFEGTLEELS